jgi:hypothetical protein
MIHSDCKDQGCDGMEKVLKAALDLAQAGYQACNNNLHP